MKAIDTKSLLIGVVSTLLLLSLTSGKTAGENELQIFTRGQYLDIYNSKTNMLYEYDYGVYALKEKIANTYQISADGANLNKLENK